MSTIHGIIINIIIIIVNIMIIIIIIIINIIILGRCGSGNCVGNSVHVQGTPFEIYGLQNATLPAANTNFSRGLGLGCQRCGPGLRQALDRRAGFFVGQPVGRRS